jgi:hypothetical protein
MSAVQLHLAVNHFPLAAQVLGLVLMILSGVWRGAALRKGALVLFVLAAVTTAPTYFTGEPAEEAIEDLPGVSHREIEEHEEAAGWAAASSGLAGVLALLALILEARAHASADRLGIAAILLAALSAAMMGRTAQLGGVIRHPEIKTGAPAEAERTPR